MPPRRAVAFRRRNPYPRTTAAVAGLTAAYNMRGFLRNGTAPPGAQMVYNAGKKLGRLFR